MCSAVVAPVTTFADEPEAWLDYLVGRTAHTIGARWTRADLVAVGTMRDTVLAVDETLKDGGTETVVLELAKAQGTGGAAGAPMPEDGDRALVFLAGASTSGRWLPIAAPGSLVPAWAVTDLDVEVGAARWFAGLPAEAEARLPALIEGAGNANRAIRSSALRAIGDEGRAAAVGALVDLAGGDAPPDAAALAAVALWLLDARAEAVTALRGLVERMGRKRFMKLWGVQETEGDVVRPVTLYGPDPSSSPYS